MKRTLETLDDIDELLDSAQRLPLTPGKVKIDYDELRDLLDDLRLNLPLELKEAQQIVERKKDIIEDAQREADDVVRKAEERARIMLSENNTVKQAKAKANEIIEQANAKARELSTAGREYADDLLKQAENALKESVKASEDVVKQAETALKESVKSSDEILSNAIADVIQIRSTIRSSKH